MIVHSKPTVWEIVTLVRLSVLPRIAWQLAVVVVLSVVAVVLHRHAPAALGGLNVSGFTLLGVALSIFLSFRNSACYDRWWEARRQLGALIGETRSLARLTFSLPAVPQEQRERIAEEIIGYVYALMAHLRGEVLAPGTLPYTRHGTFVAGAQNVPDALLRSLSAEYGAMLAEHVIGEQVFCFAQERLVAFAGIQVACERIRSTPTPYPYTLLIHRTAYTFCFLLPFGLASSLGWGTPLFCALVAYAFFGLDALGDQLEEPFGRSLNALPLNAMARTVEISLLEAMGAKTIPEPLQPVDSVLH